VGSGQINKSNLIRFYQFIYKDSDPKLCLSRKNPQLRKYWLKAITIDWVLMIFWQLIQIIRLN